MGRFKTLLTLQALLTLQTAGIALAEERMQVNDQELYNILHAGENLLDAGKLEPAAEKFREALKRDPHNKGAQVNLGGILVQQGKFEEAQPILIQATKDHPDLPEAWLDLATSYQSTGKISDSLVCLKTFLKLAPHSEYAPKVESMIKLLEQDQRRRGQLKGNDQGDDYLIDAVSGGTIRFARERMPLKVYLAPGTGVPGYKPDFDDIVRQGFDDWKASAPQYLSFVYVNNANDADITVTWTHDPSKMVSSAEGGHAAVVPQGNTILRSDIVLLTAKAGTMEDVGPNHLKHVVLHEIGHALGIFGHSPKAGDIMYGVVMPTDIASNLSDRDKHTMLALYSAKGAAVRPADESKVYSQIGDDSSPAMRVVKLNNQAAADMKAGKLSDAQAKFEEALKLDPNNFGLRQNLAAFYANMGSMSYMKRDFAGAESYFKRAIPILQMSPDKSNLKMVLRSYAAVLRTEGKTSEATNIEGQMNALK